MKAVPKSDTSKSLRQDSTTQTFTAGLSGSNEKPSVDSKAVGMLTIRLQGDSVHVKGQFSGLSSAYVSSTIQKGKGNVVQTLMPSNNANAKAGSWGKSYYWSDSQISSLKNGKLYINVASKKHPKGEIRGRFKPSNKGANDY